MTIAGVQVWITDEEAPSSLETAPVDRGSINLNFHSADGAVGEGVAGLSSAGDWNDLTGASGSGETLKLSGGSKAAVTYSFASATTWGYKNGVTDAFLKGYLDDGAHDGINGATITLSSIPFEKYSVIVYAATDTLNAKFRPVQVNGTWYVGSASASNVGYACPVLDVEKNDITWGASQNATAVYGTNAMRIDNLSGNLSIQGLGKSGNNNNRGGIAAIQVINTSDAVAAVTIGDETTWYATFAAAYGAAAVNDTADTITLLADYNATADTSVLVQNTILYLGSETIDLNGYTLTAPVLLGTIAMNGGSFKTYDYSTGTAVLYTMAGPDSDVFRTTDGVFDIQATDDGSSITALSGTLTVASTYTSSEDQELIANKDATIVIPEGVTLTLMGNATVEGTLNCSGSIVLGAADATLTTRTELGGKITTTVNDKVVVYANGVYSVGEAAAPTATPWQEVTVKAGSADAARAMVTLAVEVPQIDGTDIEGLDAETYLGYFTKKAVDNLDGTFTVEAVLNADAVRPQIATTEGAFVITKDEDGAVSKVAITISNPKKGLCYGIRVKNELSATATSDEIISLIPFSGSSDGTLTVEMDAVEDDVTAMAADAAFFTVVVEPPDAADTDTTTGEGK